jgi:hypothetical protein
VASHRVALLFLAALTFGVYSQVGGHEFVLFDDPHYVEANPHIERGLNAESVRWAFQTTYLSNWHPLTWISYMVDHEIYGSKPAGFLLTNVLLHVANTLLLFLALQRLTGAVWRSLFVAALFALHPLHVESVAWASERKDVLSGFFWMATLWAYAGYAARPRPPWRMLPVLLCLALGLMAKSMLVTLPFVLLLLDFWPLRRASVRGSGGLIDRGRVWPLVREKVPLFVLVAVASALTFAAQRESGALLESLPFPLRAGNALLAYAGYIGKAFWPVDLAVFYPHPGDDLSFARVATAGLFLGVISALVLRLARRGRPVHLPALDRALHHDLVGSCGPAREVAVPTSRADARRAHDGGHPERPDVDPDRLLEEQRNTLWSCDAGDR